jgi:hypothetical protein
MTNDNDGAALLRESVKFEREERYIVIKRKRLNVAQETALWAQMRRLHIGTVECVVVEDDWPEYETVWQMIEDRCAPHTTLQSHGQAFDAAGVREACAKVADGNVMSGNDQWSAGHDAAARKIAHAIRSLPLS